MEWAGQVQDGDVPWTPHLGLQSKGGHLCRWLHDRETKEGLPELTVPTEHYIHQHPGQERKIASKDEEKWGWEGPWCLSEDMSPGVQEAWGPAWPAGLSSLTS